MGCAFEAYDFPLFVASIRLNIIDLFIVMCNHKQTRCWGPFLFDCASLGPETEVSLALMAAAFLKEAALAYESLP